MKVKLSQILSTVLDEYKKTGESIVVGTGYFSVVLKAGNVTYKITSEGKYDKMIASSSIINKLAEEGVNVPKVYMVGELVPEQKIVSAQSFLETLKITIRDGKNQPKDVINNTIAQQIQFYLSSSSDRNTVYDLPIRILVQDYIKGKPCFVSKFRRYKAQDSDTAERISEIQKVFKNNIDFFNSIPTKHYIKFIIDATKIATSGLKLDNVTFKNFLYHPDTGFSFIDLDNVKHARVYNSQILDCTVNNILEVCSIDPKYATSDMVKNFAEICLKLFEAVTEANDQLKNISVIRNFNADSSDMHQIYRELDVIMTSEDNQKIGEYNLDFTYSIEKMKDTLVREIANEKDLSSDYKKNYISRINQIYGDQNLPTLVK